MLNLKYAAFLLLFLPSFLFGQSSHAPNLERFTLNAHRIDRPIKLSGDLSDSLWSLGQYVELGYEIQPGDNTKPRQRSVATILYNAEYLYVGYRFYDTDPSQIRANVSDRDRMFSDDFAIVGIDTYGDYQRMYEFIVNPRGIQGDMLRQGNDEDDSFETVWESAAAINDSGWTAEMAIPLKSIRFPSKPVQQWVLLLGRVYPRESQYIYSWTPFDRNNPCFMCNGGTLTGIHDIQSVTALDVLPYVIATQQTGLADTDDPHSKVNRGDLKGRAGVGVRYAPSPDLDIDAVVNPDFSQVESDATQISVNTTYAIFYPEKRPFFLLGTDFFNTRIDAYYSRIINDPLVATKMTAKAGKLTVAYLGAEDRRSPVIIPGEDESDFLSSDYKSFSNILRTRYDFGNENFVGALLTTRNFSSAHNYVGGIDWNYRFWGNWYFNGQVLASQTKELQDTVLFSSTDYFGQTGHSRSLDGELYSGEAAEVNISRQTRDYSFDFSVQDYTPTFQTYNGKVSRINRKVLHFNHSYNFWYDNNPLIDQWSIQNEMGIRFNDADVRKERWMTLRIQGQFKGQTNASMGGLVVNQEVFKGAPFPHIERMFFNVYTTPSNEFEGGFNLEAGKFIYRDTPEMGTGHNISVSATIKPTSRFRIDLSYSRARLRRITGGDLIYDGYILRANTTYQFTRELFLRLITEYDRFDRTVNVYPLLSYKLNPFTIFYAGSTYDGQNYDTTQPHNFVQTQRQFFVKFQYLIRS
jgi:Domain of unknown function (DUF5916)